MPVVSAVMKMHDHFEPRYLVEPVAFEDNSGIASCRVDKLCKSSVDVGACQISPLPCQRI